MSEIKKENAIIACEKETMTSLEVAELTGMQHAHLLRDIRKMEKGWEKSYEILQPFENQSQSKFGLSEYKDSTGRTLPMYILDKEQWLFVATKFNDTARAVLVRRWKILEEERRQYVIAREVGKIVRKTLTDALKESGENERMHGFAYSTYTNKIYKALFGMNAKQVREYLKLDKKDNIREHISEIAIKRISALEKISQHLVEMGCQYQMICEEIDNIVQKQNFGISLTQLKAA